MAALNFPDPNVTTSYTNADTGISYEWSNNVWKAVRSAQTAPELFVNAAGDNVTGNLTFGTDKIVLNATTGAASFASAVDATEFTVNGSPIGGAGSQTLVSDTMPTPGDYEVGTMWWNSEASDTSLYVLYQDPTGPNGDAGGKYWIEAAPAPDSIGFDGTHTGDSTFTGNINVTGAGTFGGGLNLGYSLTSKVSVRPSALDESGIYLFEGDAGYTGSLVKAQYNQTLAGSDAKLWEGLGVVSGAFATTSSILPDGSADFAAGAAEIRSNGQFRSQNGFVAYGTSLNSTPFRISTTSSGSSSGNVAVIRNDGSAEFASNIGIGGTATGNFGAIDKGVLITGSDAQVGLRVHTSNGSGGILEIYAESGGCMFDTRGSQHMRFGSAATEFMRFNADGSATFAGNASVGGVVSADTGFQSNAYSGRSVGITTTTQGVERALAVEDGSGGYSASLNMDGSAEFANTVAVATSYDDRDIVAYSAGYDPGFSLPFRESAVITAKGGIYLNSEGNASSSSNKIALNSTDGSATFAATVNVGSLDYTSNSGVGSEIRSDGLIRVQRASGSASSVYQAWRGNLNTLNISADGSATFASEVVAGVRDSQGVFMTSGGALESFNGGSRKYSLSSNGSAIFNSHIKTDAYLWANPTTNVAGFYNYQNLSTSAVSYDQRNAAGSITITLYYSGSATFTGNITAGNVSDIKFKENIEAAPAQLADIEAFDLKTFDWKDEAPLSDEVKAQRKLGLIAQEVEAICPEMVYEVAGQDDDSYKAINHDVLIMKLLGAVKELAAEVAALKAS